MKFLRLVRPLLVALLVLTSWFTLRLYSDLGESNKTKPTLTIKEGEGASVVAEQLSNIAEKNGGSISAAEIQLLAFLTGNGKKFKAGEYEISPNTSLSNIFGKLVRGEVIPTRVRIPEGVTWREIKAVLAKADLTHDAQNFDVAQAAQALNINAPSIEGMIFPDTYQYSKGEPETAVLKRAHELLLRKLNAEWEKRAPNLPYQTPYEALIMASIIEKETGTASDRAMVSAVFVNRLKIPMRLQTDPSVIYGMGENFKGNITKADLQRDTPFNTYTRDGLTPTPIATASTASINAALNPALSDVLYFVARGDGSSEFTKTLAEHNAAVQKYQLKK
ncbi:lipoprotein [Formosimonas limnophila]|uniref:Endolytic murein transglycosylase n=1 Tax=Formosimonas limnophila TaxID=1384487 RepID=A0A8J3G0C1_9BURK|nr:endolytic transglycosylase MltG [Formosimonas limnophila]GHA68083.1 lipoprotein [Formosimonas limnophila]